MIDTLQTLALMVNSVHTFALSVTLYRVAKARAA